MLENGKKIGGYFLVRKIGAGGFGEVWLAEKRTDFSTTQFALKFFRLTESDNNALEKEKREVAIWQKISGLPNIISIIEADKFEDYVYVVSEFADGGSLEKQILENGHNPFPIEQTLKIVLDILEGLKNLHQMSFVHRDIKPANILIRRGVYCLADFGISREIKAQTRSTQTAGTYEYMSPEAFENKLVNLHSDIWALGAIMQQLLTGRLPFPQTEIPSLIYAILNGEPERMPDFVPQGLQNIVRKALAKNPANRFVSADDMINAIKYQQALLFGSGFGVSGAHTQSFADNYRQSEQTVAFNRQEIPPNPSLATSQPSQATIISQQLKENSSGSKTSGKKVFALVGGMIVLLTLASVAAFATYFFAFRSPAENKVKETANSTENRTIVPKNSNSSLLTNSNSAQNEPLSANSDVGAGKTETNQNTQSDAPNIKDSKVIESPQSPPTTAKETRKPTEKPKTEKIQPVDTKKTVKAEPPKKQPKTKNSDCIFTGDC